MLAKGPLVLLVVTLAVFVCSSKGDTREERLSQLKEWARMPPGQEDETKRKAILEIVFAHVYAVRGEPYEIGSKTGLFSNDTEEEEESAPARKKRSFFHSTWDYFRHRWWYYGTKSSRIVCPEQADPSDVFQLDSDPTDYPGVEISDELFISAQSDDGIFFTLLELSSFPGDPPQITVDPNYANAVSSCPSEAYEVFSYTNQNSTVGGKCWLLQGFQFQDMIQFQVCQTHECRGCDSDPDCSYFTRTCNVNRCLNSYEVVQVASYCENLPEGERIIFDRIVLPAGCSCNEVQCRKRY